MGKMEELQNRMPPLMGQLKEMVELSLETIKEDPKQRPKLEKYWEDFLLDLLDYIRAREKETGVELIQNIPLTKLLKFL